MTKVSSVTEMIWPSKLKVFALWSFREKSSFLISDLREQPKDILKSKFSLWDFSVSVRNLGYTHKHDI